MTYDYSVGEHGSHKFAGQGVVDREPGRGAEFTALLVFPCLGRDPVTG